MTVTHDASGGSGSSVVIGNVDHTHTPVGTPRGVAVLISQAASGDQVSSVTYGGVAMTRVRFSNRTTSEACAAYTYVLGASVPTGPQTVRVVTTGSAAKAIRSQTVTAASDVGVDVEDGATGLAANPSVSLTPTAQAQLYYVNASGLNTPVSTPQAGTTQITTQDLGAISAHFGRKNVAGAGATTIGWTSASDDFAHAALALVEVASVVEGALDVVLPALQVDAAGSVTVEAVLDVVLPALQVQLAGVLHLPVEGALDVVLPALDVALAGDLTAAGALDVVLPALQVNLAGDLTVVVALDATLPAIDVQLAGQVEVEGVAGVLDVVLPAIDVQLAGTLTPPVLGTLDVILPALQVDLDGQIGADLVTLLGEAAQLVRDELRTANVRAVLNLAEVNPPCVWVQLDRVERRFLDGVAYIAQWNLWAIAPDARDMFATLNLLDGLQLAVCTAFQPESPVEAVPLQLPGGGDPKPALRLIVRTRVT